jgi:uncharacterized protein Yka (UPF0111/DUF47 family)
MLSFSSQNSKQTTCEYWKSLNIIKKIKKIKNYIKKIGDRL